MNTNLYVPKHLNVQPSRLWLLLYTITMPYEPKRLGANWQKPVDKMMAKVHQLVVILITAAVRLYLWARPRLHQFGTRTKIFFQQIPGNAKTLCRRMISKTQSLWRFLASFIEACRNEFSNKYVVAKWYLCCLLVITVLCIICDVMPTMAVSQDKPESTQVVITQDSENEEENKQEDFSDLKTLQFNSSAWVPAVPEVTDVQVNNEENSAAMEMEQEIVPEEEIVEVVEPEEETPALVGVSIESGGNTYTVSPILYVHVTDDKTQPLEVVNTPISADDIAVDLTSPFDSRFVYSISAELEKAISILTYAESGNQPFDGQVCVAEDIRNSFFSGVYGGDLDATCKKQYATSLIFDANGNVHLYRKDVELTMTDASTDAAAALAVRGINITGIILEAVTQIRNEQYPHWGLNESYYASGAYFHYAPDLLDEGQLNSRKIGQVPVSYQLADHVFYAKWINAKYALKLA